MNGYIIRQDGDQWFASHSDFVNLQESKVAFGDTPLMALSNFLAYEAVEEDRLAALTRKEAKDEL